MFCLCQTQRFIVTSRGYDLTVLQFEDQGYKFARVGIVLGIKDASIRGFHNFLRVSSVSDLPEFRANRLGAAQSSSLNPVQMKQTLSSSYKGLNGVVELVQWIGINLRCSRLG